MFKHANRRVRRFSLLLASGSLALVGASASFGTTGCASPDDGSVEARARITSQAQALSADAISALKGTYGGTCSGRSGDGTETWTLSMSGGPAADELSVRKNDSDCVLTVTGLVADGATYTPASNIVLDQANTYSAARSFKHAPEDPVDFFGNAKIDDLDFANDFTITLQISDDPNATDAGERAASYATQSGSVSASEYAAADYAVSFGTMNVSKDVDHVVVGVSGFAQLTEGTVTGQEYQVVAGAYDGSASLDAIEAAFTAPAPLASLESLQIPASEFLAADGSVDLDGAPQRTIIIRRTDAESGVKAYQLLLVTFTP